MDTAVAVGMIEYTSASLPSRPPRSVVAEKITRSLRRTSRPSMSVLRSSVITRSPNPFCRSILSLTSMKTRPVWSRSVKESVAEVFM